MADSGDSSDGRQLSRSGDGEEDGGQLTKSSMEGSDGRRQQTAVAMADGYEDSAWIKDG